MKFVNKNIYSKKGFTLVEVCTSVAIMVILMSVTTIQVKDNIRRANQAAALVSERNARLAMIEDQVNGGNVVLGPSDLNGIGGEKGKGGVTPGEMSSNGESVPLVGGKDETPAPSTDAAPEDNDALIEDTEAPAVINVNDYLDKIDPTVPANTISDYVESGEIVFPDKWTEDNLINLIGAAETAAKEMYQNDGLEGAMFYNYYPATGEIEVATRENRYTHNIEYGFTCHHGFKASNDSINRHVNQSFLTNTGRARDWGLFITIGVNGDTVLSNLGIDANGHVNTIMTNDTYTSERDWNNYVSCDGTGRRLF